MQDDHEESDDQAAGQDEQEDHEVYFADAQTLLSEADVGVMRDWSASECTDYKEGAFATAACASPPSSRRRILGRLKLGWKAPLRG